jgi:hypothetical protein
MEPEHGRSRVFAQWLDNEEKIQASIGTILIVFIFIYHVDMPFAVPIAYAEVPEH